MLSLINFGTGLGNWKIKSIDYDSKDIVGYIVPYHAHSDFIQLGAEWNYRVFFVPGNFYLGYLLCLYSDSIFKYHSRRKGFFIFNVNISGCL